MAKAICCRLADLHKTLEIRRGQKLVKTKYGNKQTHIRSITVKEFPLLPTVLRDSILPKTQKKLPVNQVETICLLIHWKTVGTAFLC